MTNRTESTQLKTADLTGARDMLLKREIPVEDDAFFKFTLKPVQMKNKKTNSKPLLFGK